MVSVYSTAIAIIGCGYIGLPLALAFSGKGYKVVGFDSDKTKVEQLNCGVDSSGENTTSLQDAIHSKQILFTAEVHDISACDTFIIAVPTPVDKINAPNLEYVKQAGKLIANAISIGQKKQVTILESTVYPGVTENVQAIVTSLFNNKKNKPKVHFAYSPERLSPGIGSPSLTTIKKVVSGDSPETHHLISLFYDYPRWNI